jgi:cysteine-rich repeat protein
MSRTLFLFAALSSGCLLLSGALSLPRCGDEFIHVDRGEECDDGNNDDNDGCDANCIIEFCGDGLINNNDEQCDDANRQDDDGCDENCQIELCGDGVVNNNNTEQCDDGDEQNGDGCDNDCQEEEGFNCNQAPSVCLPICGDGLIRGGEECDDDNQQGGDGCDSLCTIESGFACIDEPSDCEPICGDGIALLGEECDDGNLVDNDGCDNFCELETPICTGGIPDGLINGIEACDTNDLGGADCTTLGFAAGVLACNLVCGFDVSGCTR